MSETIPKKCAVVTGGNKGIGLEICSQLAAAKGVRVVLTARDEKKGLEAVEKLNDANVMFHQLDVTDSQSVQSLAQYVKSQFGKLDILVNNAGITGADIDAEALKAASSGATSGGAKNIINWNEIMTETYESALQCFETNYYGPKRTTEALISLLELSESPKVVNVSSSMGKLKNISNEWAKAILRKPSEDLTESEIEGVINEFLNDFKEGGNKKLEAKGWPRCFSAYTVSKAALNAYTRILASRYPKFRINCVCPGFVKTDMNHHTGVLTVREGAEGPVKLALLDGPSTGFFFDSKGVSSFEE